ncbi:MAG TPA: ornithine carbamoyltransferase [Candidatus Saccharimonadia bacterium]|jgi:ornithine carbamoyltransferase|nr:ornithine carbamoyltransferase [Candidatus Saccharimonadia bacterium]
MTKRDFLTIDNLGPKELANLLDGAAEFSKDRTPTKQLAGKSVALIFEKPSTRTRVSFEVAVNELGGYPVPLAVADLQLGRGETIEDTGQVLSRLVHAVVLRTFEQEKLSKLAEAASIPVINALSDYSHPCQALADLLTIRQHRGKLAGFKLAYLGDGNNVAHSLMFAGAKMGMNITVITPKGYEPLKSVTRRSQEIAGETGGSVTVTNDTAAAEGADALYTDVWASMGQELESSIRLKVFPPYRITEELVAAAAKDVLVMHCLPAHRGEEVAAAAIDGPHSVIFDQVENRLHTEKALLAWLLTGHAGPVR